MSDRPYINVHTLAIEMTRCCNATCEHCLRGDAEDMYMSTKHVDALLQQIDHVDEITFTGGEPTLNLQGIRNIIDLMEQRNVQFDSFYIVTNGVANQKDLAILALQLYQKAEEKSVCGIALSEDMFHADCVQNDLIKGLAFYKPDKEHDVNDDLNWVIRSGRAQENGFGKEPTWHPTKFEISETYDDMKTRHVSSIDIDMLYLSCNGYVYPDCDMSYRDMDDAKELHVNDVRKTVTDIVESRKGFD